MHGLEHMVVAFTLRFIVVTAHLPYVSHIQIKSVSNQIINHPKIGVRRCGFIGQTYFTGSNQLLHGRRLNLQEIPSKEESANVTSHYQRIRNLLQHFVKWWQHEYLLELCEFHKSKACIKIEKHITFIV